MTMNISFSRFRKAVNKDHVLYPLPVFISDRRRESIGNFWKLSLFRKDRQSHLSGQQGNRKAGEKYEVCKYEHMYMLV